MRKLTPLLFIPLLSSPLFASGGQSSLTVSSGTFKSISLYNNDDGAARQAIIIGNRTSSATLSVDNITGIPVSLSTSALTTSSAVKIDGSATTQPISGSVGQIGSYTVTPGSGTFPISGNVGQVGTYTVTPGTGTYTISGTVQPGNTPNTTGWLVQISSSLPTGSNTIGTVNAAQSGTWTVQPGNTQNTNPWQVISTYTVVSSTYPLNVTGSFSATTTEASTGTINSAVPGIATLVGAQGASGNLSTFRVDASSNLLVNVAAGGAGGGASQMQIVTVAGSTVTVGYQVGLGSVPVNVLNTVPITGNVGILGTVTSTYTVVSSTYPLNVTGSFSTTSTEASTGTINSAVPGIATLVGAQGASGNLSSFRVDTSSNLLVGQGTDSRLNASISIKGSSNTVSATQSGAWTVQPGNVLNNSGWLVQVSSALPTGTNNIGTVHGSSVTIFTSAGGNLPVQVNVSTIAVVEPAGNPLGVEGAVASGGANAHAPVKIGVVASSNVIAGVNDTQVTNVLGTRMGAILTTLDCPRENIVKSSATLTTTTSEIVILSSGAASVYNDMLEVIVLNTSGSAARVDFRSGGGPSAGTIDFGIYVPAGETRGKVSAHPWPQTSAASNWTAQSSASVTDIRIYATYCKQK